jgi:hypothetical protein
MGTKGYKIVNRKKAIPHSKDSRVRQSATHKQRMKQGLYKHRSWNKGRTDLPKRSENTKQKIRQKLIGTKLSDATRAKLKANHPDFNGANNPAWKGGLSFQPYSIDWTATLRRSIRERDNYTCRMCNKPQGDIAHDVHHIDYDKQHSVPDNLITLCKSCHKKTNSKREKWIIFFSLHLI